MTPEQIVGLMLCADAETQDGGKHWEFDSFNPFTFARLIEAATREECAKKVEQDLYPDDAGKPYTQQYNYSIRVLAEKIRSGT